MKKEVVSGGGNGEARRRLDWEMLLDLRWGLYQE